MSSTSIFHIAVNNGAYVMVDVQAHNKDFVQSSRWLAMGSGPPQQVLLVHKKVTSVPPKGQYQFITSTSAGDRDTQTSTLGVSCHYSQQRKGSSLAGRNTRR